MTVALSAPDGPVRVIAVGAAPEMVRGNSAELRHHGIIIVPRRSAAATLVEIGKDPSAVVLVPTNLEDMGVPEFVDVVRALTRVPLLMGVTPLTPSDLIADALDKGISGTVPLPAAAERLAGAVRSLRLAKRPAVVERELRCGELMLDRGRYVVTWHGADVRIAPREFEMLGALMEASPGVIRVADLVRDFSDDQTDRTARVRTSVRRIRLALSLACPGAPDPIESVHGVGYRLVC